MKSIGIKLADGSFYPILEEGSMETKDLEVTTVKDNQTKVQIDLYRSETNSMEDAEYMDSLEITQLNPHPNGEPTLNLQLNLDEDNQLHAKMKDVETGISTQTQVKMISRTLEERAEPANFALNDSDTGLLPGIDAVNSILNTGSPNDEEFNFDPVPNIFDDDSENSSTASTTFDDDNTTLDLDSLQFDGLEPQDASDENAFDLSSEIDNGNDFPTEETTANTNFDDDDTTLDLNSLQFDGLEPQDASDENDFDFPSEIANENDLPAEESSTANTNFDDDNTTLDMNSLQFDGLVPQEAPVDDQFMSDPQVIDEDIVSDKPLTDEDLINPNDFNFEESAPSEDMFIDKDGTGFNFVDETPISEPTVEPDVIPEEPSEDDSQIAQALLDPSLYDETLGETIEPENLDDEFDELSNSLDQQDLRENQSSEEEESEIVDTNIAPNDIDDDLGLDEFDDDDFPEPEKDEEKYRIPDFNELGSNKDFMVPESEDDHFNFELPAKSNELETPTDSNEIDNNSADNDYGMPSYENLPTSNIEETETEIHQDDESTDNIDEEVNGDLSDSIDESLSLPDLQDDFDDMNFGDDSWDDSSASEEKNNTASNFETDFDDDLSLPPLIDKDALAKSNDETESTKFDIDDLDLPDFENLDGSSSESLPNDFPEFDDPFNSLSSPTANTEFEFPDFDDSPARMELEKEQSSTRDIFGDFDDTDAVFDGDTDDFVDPTAGKKKSKKSKASKQSYSYGSSSEFSDDNEKGSKKPIIILLAALLACLVVILVLVLKSRTPNSVKRAEQEIAQIQKTQTTIKHESVDSESSDVISEESLKRNDIVTSMGEPRAEATDTSKDEVVEKSNDKSDSKTENKSENKSEKENTSTEAKDKEPTKKNETTNIPAQEDVIIVATNPETVVPQKKASSSNKNSDIKYTIVWGDTLWDISSAYYKTPYRYTRIAEYNGITDANKIKSGQVLLIPEE